MRTKISKSIIFSIVVFTIAVIFAATLPSVTVSAAPMKMSKSFDVDMSKQVVTDTNKTNPTIEEMLTAKVEDIQQRQQVIEAQTTSSSSTQSYSNGSGLTRNSGVNYHDGWRETYYSSNVLYHYRTGEWTADSNGVYRDSDGYVVVASSSDAKGSVVSTSFGAGKVYDTGCAAGTHDIYTNW